MLDSPEDFVDKLIHIAGGRESAFAYAEESHGEIQQAWQKDAVLIGRVLRAHLFVEHFVTKFIETANPRLGSLDEARLTYLQKVHLACSSGGLNQELRPGLIQLNRLRNRFAHQLEYQLTSDDVAQIIGVVVFRAFREAGAAPHTPSMSPIDIIEEFAKFAATMFQHEWSEFSKLIGKALNTPDQFVPS
jgi:hypothetical protein